MELKLIRNQLYPGNVVQKVWQPELVTKLWYNLENVKTRIKLWHVSLIYEVQRCEVGEDIMC
jgi:hypothetical protein